MGCKYPHQFRQNYMRPHTLLNCPLSKLAHSWILSWRYPWVMIPCLVDALFRSIQLNSKAQRNWLCHQKRISPWKILTKHTPHTHTNLCAHSIMDMTSDFYFARTPYLTELWGCAMSSFAKKCQHLLLFAYSRFSPLPLSHSVLKRPCVLCNLRLVPLDVSRSCSQPDVYQTSP